MKQCLVQFLKEVSSASNLKKFSNPIDWSEADSYAMVISASTDKWASYQQLSCKLITVEPGATVYLKNNTSIDTAYCFLKEGTPTVNASANYATGSTNTSLIAGGEAEVIAPSDAVYLYVTATSSNGSNCLPDATEYDL